MLWTIMLISTTILGDRYCDPHFPREETGKEVNSPVSHQSEDGRFEARESGAQVHTLNHYTASWLKI